MQYSLAILALVAAVQANPVAIPQAVTASIAPSASAPAGCSTSASGSFGIAVHNVSTSAPVKRAVATQISDGQPQVLTGASVSMITDGQIQAGFHTMMMMPVANQITDGQIQLQTTLAPVTQINDGQPQAPTVGVTSTATPVSQATDAQIVAPTSIAAPATSAAPATTTAPATTAAPATSAAPATTSASSSSTFSTSSSSTSSTSSSAAAASSSSGVQMVACDSSGTLAITLDGGVLKDSKARTGYIASNYQFQFDGPPQAGAIYTAGFSICANSSLALGGSNIFYQCLSGSFYNLYDRSWAAQCSPVTISALMLQQC
ncbi:hypothetical protein MMC28_005159 [Mycoblastus sanguinarius]|nr:hypothetical protein [Mycoblastus sanguinarius]